MRYSRTQEPREELVTLPRPMDISMRLGFTLDTIGFNSICNPDYLYSQLLVHSIPQLLLFPCYPTRLNLAGRPTRAPEWFLHITPLVDTTFLGISYPAVTVAPKYPAIPFVEII